MESVLDSISFARFYKDRVLRDYPMSMVKSLMKHEVNKSLIAELIYERLYSRFLKIFDYYDGNMATYDKGGVFVKRIVFTEEYKNGFLIMTSCSLLIENLASFLTGENFTPRGKSTEMFNKVFLYAEKNDNPLKVFKDSKFYEYIRCGLLHQGEVYGSFKITRQGRKLLNGNTVDASLFFIYLKSLLESYKQDLFKAYWEGDYWKACKKKLEFIIENASI